MSAGVGGFDAEHAWPFFVAEIGHGLGLGDPGVPDDGGVGAALGDGDLAAEDRIVNDTGRLRVQIDAVGFGGEGDGGCASSLAFRSVDLVEVADAGQAGDAGAVDVADDEIGVQGFLDRDGSQARLVTVRVMRSCAGDADAVLQREVGRPEAAGEIRRIQAQDDVDGAIAVDAIE